MHRISALLLVCLSLSACQQTPAQVFDNGKNSYAKNAVVNQPIVPNAPAFVSQATERLAKAESFTSNDLAPITAAPAPKPTSSLFIKPVDGPEVSSFGDKNAGALSDGINIEANKGTPVKAAASGEVVFVGNQIKTYGNMVIIKHENKLNTTYALLDNINVKKGQQVKQGDVVGNVGSSGAVTTPQLHFAVRIGAQPQAPSKYLPTQSAKAL